MVSHGPGALEDYGNGFDIKEIAVVLKNQLMKEFKLSASAARDDICGDVGLTYLSNDGSRNGRTARTSTTTPS